MKKAADFIVKYRYVFLLLFAAMIVYSVINISNVKVEKNISAYLPGEADSKKALDIMADEFPSMPLTKLVVCDVTYEEAEELHRQISSYPGVLKFDFADTEEYYRDSCALFNITFRGNAEDEKSLEAYNGAVELLSEYEVYYSVRLVDDYNAKLTHSMLITLAISVVIVILVLILTCNSFAEVLIFPIVFVVAAVLNIGTNCWFGTISFVSNAVEIVLQLALAIDYSIILCHRFREEKELSPSPSEAMSAALTKAIPEILSSSLTTVSGLLALLFMQLTLGRDLGLVLGKSIVFSLLTVIFIMPTFIILLSSAIGRTTHKSFIPRIDFLGRAIVKSRFALIAVFLVLTAICGTLVTLSQSYSYSVYSMSDAKGTEERIAADKINEVFGYNNAVAVVVPIDEVEGQRKILDEVSEIDGVKSALGLENIEVDGVRLMGDITYKEFADVAGISPFLTQTLFSMYASEHGESEILSDAGIAGYTVRTMDILTYLCEIADRPFISAVLNEEKKEYLSEISELLEFAKLQLCGKNYTRLVFTLDAPVQSDETTAMVEKIMTVSKKYSPDSFCTGDSVAVYDLAKTFESDIIKISLFTDIMIFIILCLTFRSPLISLLLVLVIQGAIYISFTYPILRGNNVFFFVYLIGTAVQMGATIDYAIVITNHYLELRKTHEKREAIVKALSDSFPTVLTSGTIFTVCAFLVGLIISDAYVSTMGIYLGRGTIVSVICVLIFLPVLLFTLDKPLRASVFSIRKKPKNEE